MGNLSIDSPAPHVFRILINRPEKLNAVDADVRTALIQAFTAAFSDSYTRAVVFGGVTGNLSAGGDLPSMVGMTKAQAVARMDHGHHLCRLVAEAKIAVVTAAEGVAAGASLGLALLSDYIVAGTGTIILLPFLKLGLVPDWGLLRTLPMRVGFPVARRLILEAKAIRGEEAARINLVDACVADHDVMASAVAKAAEFATLPLQALSLVKARWLGQSSYFETDLTQEASDQVICFLGDEFKEGFAAFKEKRPADFAGIKG